MQATRAQHTATLLLFYKKIKEWGYFDVTTGQLLVRGATALHVFDGGWFTHIHWHDGQMLTTHEQSQIVSMHQARNGQPCKLTIITKGLLDFTACAKS